MLDFEDKHRQFTSLSQPGWVANNVLATFILPCLYVFFPALPNLLIISIKLYAMLRKLSDCAMKQRYFADASMVMLILWMELLRTSREKYFGISICPRIDVHGRSIGISSIAAITQITLPNLECLTITLFIDFVGIKFTQNTVSTARMP